MTFVSMYDMNVVVKVCVCFVFAVLSGCSSCIEDIEKGTILIVLYVHLQKTCSMLKM